MKRLTAITGLVCVSASAALGQGRETLATLRGGDTVKVWAVGPRLNGELGAFGGFASDTLVLQPLPFEPSAVARATVSGRADAASASGFSNGFTPTMASAPECLRSS